MNNLKGINKNEFDYIYKFLNIDSAKNILNFIKNNNNILNNNIIDFKNLDFHAKNVSFFKNNLIYYIPLDEKKIFKTDFKNYDNFIEFVSNYFKSINKMPVDSDIELPKYKEFIELTKKILLNTHFRLLVVARSTPSTRP